MTTTLLIDDDEVDTARECAVEQLSQVEVCLDTLHGVVDKVGLLASDGDDGLALNDGLAGAHPVKLWRGSPTL